MRSVCTESKNEELRYIVYLYAWRRHFRDHFNLKCICTLQWQIGYSNMYVSKVVRTDNDDANDFESGRIR